MLFDLIKTLKRYKNRKTLKQTALKYISGMSYFQWNPKITTLPGLYLLAALILSPLKLCNIFYMRSINLFGTFLNFFLVYNIIKQISTTHSIKKWNDWTKLAVAYSVMFLPPLFFWHFLYYTDVVSVNVVLLMLLLHLRKEFKMAAFIGTYENKCIKMHYYT